MESGSDVLLENRAILRTGAEDRMISGCCCTLLASTAADPVDCTCSPEESKMTSLSPTIAKEDARSSRECRCDESSGAVGTNVVKDDDDATHSSCSDPMDILRPALVKLAVELMRFIPAPPPVMLSGIVGVYGTARTAIIFKSSRFNLGLADNAVPMTLRSAQRLPVGMLTSILVPRYRMGSFMSAEWTKSTAKTGLNLIFIKSIQTKVSI